MCSLFNKVAGLQLFCEYSETAISGALYEKMLWPATLLNFEFNNSNLIISNYLILGIF